MTTPFPTHKAACLALLNSAPLKAKEGSFLGQIAFENGLTEKQLHWLVILLDRHGLPALANGGAS